MKGHFLDDTEYNFLQQYNHKFLECLIFLKEKLDLEGYLENPKSEEICTQEGLCIFFSHAFEIYKFVSTTMKGFNLRSVDFKLCEEKEIKLDEGHQKVFKILYKVLSMKLKVHFGNQSSSREFGALLLMNGERKGLKILKQLCKGGSDGNPICNR